ncbi:MAG TPA: TetR/AcrR family transcriptional regulator [Chitinophagaceae bacterium]|jgi:AcrR family transcriptional regulator|nr:TetR/AcrR family transcriptional regulator [Chitinophagaceae bacterium]
METQERILIKAHELFMRYGLRSVSMDEIANHLGMSKKTIYQFYADKDALVEGAIGIEIDKSKTDCTGFREESENAIHELMLTVDRALEMLKHMNPSVMFDLEKYHPKAYRKFLEHKNKFFYELIKSNLEWGIKDELYRSEIDVEILTRFRLATIFLMFDTESFPPSKFTAAQIIAEITDNFLYGMASAKGLKMIQKYKQQRLKK